MKCSVPDSRYPGQAKKCDPAAGCCRDEWGGHLVRPPNFVGPRVSMSTAILASFVPVLPGLGTWPQPFLRRNGPKSRNAAGGQRPRRRPRCERGDFSLDRHRQPARASCCLLACSACCAPPRALAASSNRQMSSTQVLSVLFCGVHTHATSSLTATLRLSDPSPQSRPSSHHLSALSAHGCRQRRHLICATRGNPY